MSKLPAQLVVEVEELIHEGLKVELREVEGLAFLIISGFYLPPGYNKNSTDLLLKFLPSYPSGRPDMFWTDEDVLLVNGGIPKNAEVIETYLGRKWRRFSWHPGNWNPVRDNLRTYLEFVNNRLSKSE